jgi:L-seryl-tRNA(Ser) seleniumtransferase
LECTLLFYLDEKKAMKEIPTLRMLGLDLSKLKRRARRLSKKLSGVIKEAEMSLREDVSQVGGGALPLQDLPTMALIIRPRNFSVNKLEENLRKGDPPIICRISKEELVLDMRTVFDEEIPLLAAAIERALAPTRNL